MTKKNISIGIQDFERLIESGSFYLDKTKQIYDMVKQSAGYYYFSRPRRFGKSTLLSTMKNIYLGKKKLFKDLYIEDKWNWQETNPVLYIDFTSYHKAEDLKEFIKLNGIVFYHDENNNLVEKTMGNYKYFNIGHILEEIHKETGKKTAILVDEYDKPYLAHFKDPKKAEEIRDFFSGFYAPMKDSDRYIKIFMLTGLTKLMKMSALNNLSDITFLSNYTDLIGYSQVELEYNFKEEIKEIAQERNKTNEEQIEELKIEYNGFNFGDKNLKLYSPWNINNFIKKRHLNYFWSDTGIPSIIKEYARNTAIDTQKMIDRIRDNRLFVVESELKVRYLSHIRIEALFLNSGYLTIKEIVNDREYYLTFPNKETETVILKYFRDLV